MGETKRVRRVEHDPCGGWIARDKFGVEYMEPGWRWNSRSVAQTVVLEDKAYGDIGVAASRAAHVSRVNLHLALRGVLS